MQKKTHPIITRLSFPTAATLFPVCRHTLWGILSGLLAPSIPQYCTLIFAGYCLPMETEEYFFTRVCIHKKKREEINAKMFSNFPQTDGFLSSGRICFKPRGSPPCWSEHKAYGY